MKVFFDELKGLLEEYDINAKIILGGKTRQESVYKSLQSCNEPELVLIHDGARPLVSKEILCNAITVAQQKGSAVAMVRAKDTIKIVKNGCILKTLARENLYNVQTPQIFNYQKLLAAHENFKGMDFTDDSSLLEELGEKIYITDGSYKNIKITTAEDIVIANALNS